MKKQINNIERISKMDGKYILEIGEMGVELVYSKKNRSFNECILNILKRKLSRN